MGNTSSASAQSLQKTSKCNSCSQSGLYFSFGKRTDTKLYALIKGKQRRVYVDSKGKYYKENSKKKYLRKNYKTFKLSDSKKHKKNNYGYFFYNLSDRYKSPTKSLEYKGPRPVSRPVSRPKRKSPKRKSPKRKSPKRKSGPKGPKGPKRKPKGYYLRKKVKSPLRKVVKDKKKRTIGSRLSARAVFNQMGMSAIGKPFSILQKDGTYKRKYLRLRQNGSPYFANNFGKKHPNDGPIHLNFQKNKNWLRGPYPGDDMTGLKYSWPNYGYNIPPAGVAQPLRTSLLPRISAGTRRGNNYGNNFGNVTNVPHMHYGKMCFGA